MRPVIQEESLMEINDHLNPLKLLLESGNNGGDEYSQKITDLFPAIVYIYDVDSKKLKYINRKITDVLGYSYEDVKNWRNNVMDIVFREDLDLVKQELDKFYSLRDDESHFYNARLNHKLGNWKYFRTQGSVLARHSDGKAASVLFIAQDITSEVETGNQFRRIEELFNDTQEVLKFGVWEWDVPANNMVWSTGLYKLLGYDPVREKNRLPITPEFYLQHIVEEDRERVIQNRQQQLNYHDYDLHYRISDRNGRVREVRDKAKVIRNQENELQRVIGSTIDITEQQQLYKDLSAYKKMKQENEEFLMYGTWEYDALHDRYNWSDGMYRLFGYDPEKDRNAVSVNESLYRKHMNSSDFEKSKVIREAINSRKEKEENYSWEFEIVTGNNSIRKVETSGKMIYDDHGNWVKTIGTTRDITKLRQYQQSLEEKVRDLNRSNKELEEFAYVASHDMNEPLRKITTFIERLETRHRSELGNDGQLYLNRIKASVENMRLLIDTLLEFSRTTRSNLPFEQASLEQLLKEVIADLELTIEETGCIINCGNLPVVEAIPSQLKQLFNNLISNAIKFRKPGTHPVITIHCYLLSAKQKDDLNLAQDKTWYKIDLTDNGIGFEQEYCERIFQIFQRLHGKAEYPGSGIGLAICKKIIDHHNGIIFASGESQQGATFSIILPECQ